MPDDRPSTLDQIRERARVAAVSGQDDGVALWIGALGASQEDVPLLLAAIERALEKAAEWEAEAKRLESRSGFLFERDDQAAAVLL